MLARRYHDERCQNRLAAWSASACVASSWSSVAAQAGTRTVVGQSAAMSERLNASLAGYMAFEPKPSASRWYGVNRSADPSPEKAVTIVTAWPGSAGVAAAAPCPADRDGVCETPGPERRARLGYERPLPFDRRHVRPEPRQDRRLIAGSRPDLEDAITGSDREILGHLGDHVRLADRLAGADREGLVRVRVALDGIRDEQLARDRAHRRQHPFVGDPTLAQLAGDHSRPRVGRIRG